MAKDDAINAVPMASGSDSGTRSYFKNIIDAISQIQQFAVMERSDYEIPEDFLTLRGALNFFNVGFGNGFIEGMLFTLLLAMIMPMMHSDYLMDLVALRFPLARSRAFLWFLNLLPIIIAVILCSYLSRYRIGKITKRAIDALLVGRMFSLIIKAIIIFVLLILLYRYNDQIAYGLGYPVARINGELGNGVYHHHAQYAGGSVDHRVSDLGHLRRGGDDTFFHHLAGIFISRLPIQKSPALLESVMVWRQQTHYQYRPGGSLWMI